MCRAVFCGTWKTLALSILLTPVSNGFVTLTTSGGAAAGSAPIHTAALTGADTEPAHWALIFDCDGVILEVCHTVFFWYFSPGPARYVSPPPAQSTLRTYER